MYSFAYEANKWRFEAINQNYRIFTFDDVFILELYT